MSCICWVLELVLKNYVTSLCLISASSTSIKPFGGRTEMKQMLRIKNNKVERSIFLPNKNSGTTKVKNHVPSQHLLSKWLTIQWGRQRGAQITEGNKGGQRESQSSGVCVRVTRTVNS